VPEFCTCGARLPEDARFCHKCGKPQFDVPAAEPELPPPIPFEVTLPPEINFRNPAAVRVGLMAACLASLILQFPFPAPVVIKPAALLLGGFFAVYLYHRRTGQPIGVQGGMRIGWITGVFCFAIATLFVTLFVITAVSWGGFAAVLREALKEQVPADRLEQFMQVLKEPSALASLTIVALAMLFVPFTLFPTLGGALGAKLLERE
jgi:hypothetical protein